LNNCAGKKDCLVKISDFTDFSWDKLYVFDYRQESLQINKIVGFPTGAKNNNSNKMIFVQGGNVVYLEEKIIDVLHPKGVRMYFTEADRKNFAVYSNNVIFSAEFYGNTFSLRCTNCE
jgi:hypothetical protein